MIRWIGVAFVLVIALSGALFYAAGRGAPPAVQILQPERVVGERATLVVTAEAPHGRFTTLVITLEQNGRSTPLFSLAGSGTAGGAQASGSSDLQGDRLSITQPFGKAAVPELQAGPARVTVTASRPSLLGLRQLETTVTKDFQVRLEPPRIAVLSTHHYVNRGGSEMVIYRATPADVISGVRVGELEYPGFAVDSGAKVAFFALLHDQDLRAPIVAFARDEAGNEAKAAFVDHVFDKKFHRSRIEIDDRFLQRVVPEISQHTPALQLGSPSSGEELLRAFLKINGVLRQNNADAIAALARQTSASRLWDGPFLQLGNSQVEAGFADYRTYFYRGQEVDRQVHLGFDLAVTAAVPVAAANAGRVAHASYLGIFGNCVIIDHGLGVYSLYGHLSSIDVKGGDSVSRGHTIGRSGMTGLAGGDHVHFTMLVGGRPVNPVEWWDGHWVADRVERKLREAGVVHH